MIKKTLDVIDNKLHYGHQQYTIEDLFTLEFYKWADSRVSSFASGEMFDNVIYINFILNVLAIQYFIITNNICQITIISAEKELVCYVTDAANLANVAIDNRSSRRAFAERLKVRGTFFAAGCYLLLQQCTMKRTKPSIDINKDVCVIRSLAAKRKILSNEAREIFYEDKICKGSLYSVLSMSERVRLLYRAYIDANQTYTKAKKLLEKYQLHQTKHLIIDFLRIRLIPVLYYGLALDSLLSRGWKGRFISGNNLDMYAYVEEQIAHKHNIMTVCIPHGLEYGYRLPHVFTGDIFYTTSAHAASYLNEKYSTSKFVFDSALANSMFNLDHKKKTGKKREIVFFTEPRESYVNKRILEVMIPILKEKNIVLNLKHHPKDDLNEYAEIHQNVRVIEDLNEAVINNICISRKSTILLEALYNGGISAAIIINEKDNAIFHTFPSLSNPNIFEFHDIYKLCEWIIETQVE